MFGLCMPTGETYLVLKNKKLKTVMLSDESNPRKRIMTDKDILNAVKRVGYKNVESIVYTSNYKTGTNKVVVSMADYYAEHGQELEEEKH